MKKLIIAVMAALLALSIGLGFIITNAFAVDVDIRPAEPSENGIEREPVFRLTEEGKKMLARLVYLEVGGQSADTQRMITEVILNRLDSEIWGNTITDVMFAPGQFPPVSRLYTVPEDEIYDQILGIVKTVCMEGCQVLPSRVIFYCEFPFSWAVYEGYSEGCYFASSVYYPLPDGMTWTEWRAE